MKILPVINNPFSIKMKNNHYNDYSQRSAALRSSPMCDTVSFGRTAHNAEALRKLMDYGIPCMYSGVIVIPSKKIEEMLSKSVFSGTLKQVIKALEPYEKSLHETQSKVFALLKTKSMANPNMKLDEAMLSLAPDHNERLKKIQRPIFEELEALSKLMPDEQKVKFDEFMNTVKQKIEFKPIFIPFSAKEFKYKLQRIYNDVQAKNNKNEIDAMESIMFLASQMPEKSKTNLAEIKNIKSKVIRNQKTKNEKAEIRKRAELLKIIESIQLHSNLSENYELSKLLHQTRAKIFNIAQVVAFNRKTFIHELNKITSTLEDKKLARIMSQTAVKLPKSHDNVSAFIVKYANSSPQKIGYDLIAPSEGCIDHMIAFAENGKDNLTNYGICSAYYNSDKGKKSMQKQLKDRPETYINCPKQMNRLIELYNDGTFKKVGLSRWYILSFVHNMFKFSPEDNRMILDLSRLKD